MEKPTVIVSSTVYGQEYLLNQVYAVLLGYGYRVWMSHKGTIPINPGRHAFQDCIAAVESADATLGIINGRYGSGKEGDELSITHMEMLRAIELNKPRFFAVHHHVIIARQLLKDFRNDDTGKPKHHKQFNLKPVLDDIRILDLYDSATMADVALNERKGNWVQQYTDEAGLLLFIESQFSDISRFKSIVSTNKDEAEVLP